MSSLKIGLPAKGRLRSAATDWLGRFGARVVPLGSERAYSGSVAGLNGIEPVFLPAGEIPGELQQGRIHLGITGQDLIREKLPFRQAHVDEICALGFGHADLVIAVPACWTDVWTIDDLDEVAGQFRDLHGRPLRIATKYHNLVREFLAGHELADYRLVDSQGATEATVRNLAAEVVADITATGQTLGANHLKVLDDGIVLSSQAALFACRRRPWTTAETSILKTFGARAGFDVPESPGDSGQSGS